MLDDTEEQSARLENFESKVVKPQALNPHIADVDMIFLICLCLIDNVFKGYIDMLHSLA